MALFNDTPPIRIGFIPLLDAAPIIAAHELGYFSQAGLDVRIKSEPGWATIHDKFVFGEIEAAHALAGQALSISVTDLGKASLPQVPCYLNRGGAFIVLANKWVEEGIVDARQLLGSMRARSQSARPTFGAVSRYSSHGYLLDEWFSKAGASEDAYRSVHLPPSLLARNLSAGHLDGFCAGEPWCSESVEAGHGTIVASGERLLPNHADKVLLLSSRIRSERVDECRALVRCIIEAAEWCDDPANYPDLAAILVDPRYLGVSVDLIQGALDGRWSELPGKPSPAVSFGAEAMNPDGHRLGWLAKKWRAHDWDGVEKLPLLLDSELYSEAMAERTSGALV